MELVPVSSRRSSRLPLSQSSSSLPRQARPQVMPANRERGRASSGSRAARAETSQSTPRRHPPPPRSTRQQYRRAVPGATEATGRP
jgi:hypothetical protein